MNQTVYSLCALCTVAGICELVTSDGTFAAPVKLLIGLEVAMSVLRMATELLKSVV